MTEQTDAISAALVRLEEDLRALSPHWLPRTEELRDFLRRWERAWNTHDLDLLGTLVTEDIVCRDPALFGADFYRFRDGLLCDYSIVYDLLGFSVQVGLFG